jgi:pyruvate dehydrogenase (quinone)
MVKLGRDRRGTSPSRAALLDLVTDPNALSMPPNITAEEALGFALAVSRTVLGGGVGKMLQLARSNLRNIPRP